MADSNSVTSFKVAGEYFAFETQSIRHILEFSKATRVPLSKPFFKGIINNHGNMIPVVDFRVLIGKEADDSFKEQSIIVTAMELGGKEELCGFKVDEMDDVFEYQPDDFSPEVVIEVNPEVQRSVAGTIKAAGKFVYLLKSAELAQSLL